LASPLFGSSLYTYSSKSLRLTKSSTLPVSGASHPDPFFEKLQAFTISTTSVSPFQSTSPLNQTNAVLSQALYNHSQHQTTWPSPLLATRQLPSDTNINHQPTQSDFHPTAPQSVSLDPNSATQQPPINGVSGIIKSLGYNAQLAGQQLHRSPLPVTRAPLPVNQQSRHQVVTSQPLSIPRAIPNQLRPRQDQRPFKMSPDMLDLQNSPVDFGSPVFSGPFSAGEETLFDLPTSTISPYDMLNLSNIGLSASGSPDYLEGSPLLEADQGSPLDEWMPLFNDDLGGDITAFVQPSSLHEDEESCAMDRSISTSSSAPSCSSPTIGVIGGKIAKKSSRKRASRDLGPIKYDPNNPVEVKRAKNTAAARKSREKKQKHVEELEARLAESEERERQLREENRRLLDRLRLQEMSPAWPLA